jgi:hypothetical protein
VKKFILGLAALLAAWLFSRGARDPREWPRRLPEELSSLWNDIDDAFGAARRAAQRQEKDFDDEMRRARRGD